MSGISNYQAQYGFQYRRPNPLGSIRTINPILGPVSPVSIFNRGVLSPESERAMQIFVEQGHDVPQSFKHCFSNLQDLNHALEEIGDKHDERIQQVAVIRAEKAAQRSMPPPAARSVEHAQDKGLLPPPKKKEVPDHKMSEGPVERLIESLVVVVKVFVKSPETQEEMPFYVAKGVAKDDLLQQIRTRYPSVTLEDLRFQSMPQTIPSKVAVYKGVPCIYAS